jgi:hypothetical protein
VLGFATGPSFNPSEQQPISSKNDENSYQWRLLLKGQYLMMSVNGASTICGFVCTVIE